jgi:hypothetical protein
LVLIDPSSMSIHEPGLYLENGLVMGDFVADFESFYRPLKAALLNRLKAAGEPWRGK